MKRMSLLVLAVMSLLVVGCENGQMQLGGKESISNPSPLTMEQAASARSNMVGKQAPDFALQDQDEKPVRLADLRGRWVVLYFYPKDDTPGCSCQANDFTDMRSKFENLNTSVYGVSTDPPEIHRLFIEKLKLDVDLLSDPNHKTMRDYGAWAYGLKGDESTGRVVRSTFIIGPDGTIRHHWPEVIPVGHAKRVRDKLVELQSEQAKKE